MDLSEMRNYINDPIALITIGNKRDDNKSFMNNEGHRRRAEDIKSFKINTKCKRDYRNTRKYDVVLINDKERALN